MIGLTCEECRFWDSKTGVLSEGDGYCRRKAPTPDKHDASWPIWPITDQDDWCGEGKKKQPRPGGLPSA